MIYVGDPDGSARPLIGEEGVWQECPAFSPDGSMLAFSEAEGGQKSVVVAGFSAGALQDPTIRIPVSASRSFVHPCPAWSPDGQRIATVVPGRGVLIADLDGGRELVRFDDYSLTEGGDLDLAWSPDGTQLAFLASPTKLTQVIRIIPADGDPTHVLTELLPDGGTSGMSVNDIAWTADGRSVVVAGGPCCVEGRPFLRVIDVATGEGSGVPLPEAIHGYGLQMLPAGDDRFILMWDWQQDPALFDLEGNETPIHLEHPPTSFLGLSPDGKQLLYVTYDQPPTPDPDCNGQYLVAVPIAGGRATRYSPCSDPGFGDNYSVFSWQPIPHG
jgi:WD40 repeat protein